MELECAARLKLGQTVPESPHAVCVHFPTLEDVIGYEERRPGTVEKIHTGYPRFVRNPLIIRLAEVLSEKHGLKGRVVFPVSSIRGAKEMDAFCGAEEGEWFRNGNLVVYHCEDDGDVVKAAGSFLQHTGASISSRLAEDRLHAIGEIRAVFKEEMEVDHPQDIVRYAIAKLYQLRRPDGVLLCNSGMNAFYSVFKAIGDVAEGGGRNIWVRLGWLYLDTNRILERFVTGDGGHEVFHDVHDLSELEAFLRQYGHRVAAVVTEVPTNPLIQTVDLARLRELADHFRFRLIVDPSVASPYNIRVLPYADVVVNSLTKYAACDGDVMMGAAIFNPERPGIMEILARTVAHHEPPYSRDIARLAVQITKTEKLLRKVNPNTVQVATFLNNHPKVNQVYWAYARDSRMAYESISRWPVSPGAIISFELGMPLAEFFDRCPLVKGPSFGTRFTILCPYLYLAHYDLVSTAKGRAFLEALDISPELVRLSVGVEPYEEIVAALRTGLEG